MLLDPGVVRPPPPSLIQQLMVRSHWVFAVYYKIFSFRWIDYSIPRSQFSTISCYVLWLFSFGRYCILWLFDLVLTIPCRG